MTNKLWRFLEDVSDADHVGWVAAGWPPSYFPEPLKVKQSEKACAERLSKAEAKRKRRMARNLENNK